MRVHWRFSLLLALAVAGVGCSSNSGTTASGGSSKSSGSGGRRLTVGFAQEGAESGWRTAETKSIQDEADKRGIDLKFADAQGKQENQIKAIHSFIAMNVDGIILAPAVKTGWDPVLKEAKNAHIPVVLVDRGIDTNDPSLYVTLIASDFIEEGRRTAAYLAKRMNGKGNIVEIEGSTGSDPALDRKKGFDDEIAKYPGMHILVSQSGDFKRTGGKQVMEAFLKAQGKNINAVYAHNDDMALGAIQAIQEAGLKPGKDILVVSIDGVHDAFVAMAQGTLNCTTECNPLLGPQAFDALQKAIDGKQVEHRIIQKDEQFDQTVAAKVLPTRKY